MDSCREHRTNTDRLTRWIWEKVLIGSGFDDPREYCDIGITWRLLLCVFHRCGQVCVYNHVHRYHCNNPKKCGKETYS